MRKKQHKKINPRNTAYDKFYLINYLEVGKSWEEVQSEDDREIIGQEEKYVCVCVCVCVCVYVCVYVSVM